LHKAVHEARTGSAANWEPIDPIELVSATMPAATDWAYQSATVSVVDREAVTTMFGSIRDTLATEIDATRWLSDESRAATLDAIQAMTVDVGPIEMTSSELRTSEPNRLGADSLQENLLLLGRMDARRLRPAPDTSGKVRATTVNAVYRPASNTVVIPAALLRPPFFDPDWPLEQSYGAVGALIGHEIFHLFDPPQSGGRLTASWTEAERAHLDALRSEVDRAIDGLPIPGSVELTTDGAAVSIETLSDIAGLQLARTALANRLARSPSDQAFLESWAFMWRFAASQDFLQRTASNPRYAHAAVRCDLAASEFDRPFVFFLYNRNEHD
jgi:putative endopeptidase